MDISEIVEPVANGRKNGEFRQKMMEIPVGKARIISDTKQGLIASRVSAIGRSMTPPAKFSTRDLGDGKIQVTRVS